ncbi:MAG: tail fiber domain-containing protein [Bacillota bacterium]
MGYEIINPHDYGAVGNGTSDDTQAFEAIEQEYNNMIVNLLGKTYLVTDKFSGNIYLNGYFKINDEIYDAPFQITRSGNTNVFAGKQAGQSNDLYYEKSGGYRNVGIGELAMSSNGSDIEKAGWRNVAIGHSAMRDNVVGYNNVSVGDSALERNVGNIINSEGKPSRNDEGSRNTALGSYALRYNVSGRGNVGVGRNAAHANETGNYNTAVGTNAYSGTVTEGGQQDRKQASENTAVGYNALFNTNEDRNTGVGAWSLYNNETGTYNTIMGWKSAFSSTANNRLISIGSSTMRDLEGSGNHDNVAVGTEAMRYLKTGHSNTALGDKSLSYDVNGNPLTSVKNSIGIGKQSRVSGDNQLQLGASSVTTYAYGAIQNRSDQRDKSDIRDTALGLDFILKLRPRDFKWDYRDDYTQVNEDGTITKLEKDGTKKRNRYHHGLIAQEVESVMNELNIDFGGFQDHKINDGNDVLSIGYTELISPLIKAIQDLNEKVESLQIEIEQLRKK